MRASLSLLILLAFGGLQAQVRDSLPRDTVQAGGRTVTLSEVVVRSGMDPAGFIERVRRDTTFYKAFRNLRILNYTSLNDVRMIDKKGKVKASQQSRTRQHAWADCRVTEMLEEKHTGDFLDRSGGYNYYTAKLFESLFFSFDTVCGQHNRVRDADLGVQGKSGIEKRKEQLKMLFFNPGSDIPGIPLMGDKVRIFDKGHARLYDFDIDIRERDGTPCYVFGIKARPGLNELQDDRVVIDEMVTWFDYRSLEVLERSYSMSYDAGVYRFDVEMQVGMQRAAGLLVPSVIRYDGIWSALGKRERGVFTATVFDVSR
jgi:hypothetical protein